jgi:hypothetical protein
MFEPAYPKMTRSLVTGLSCIELTEKLFVTLEQVVF